MSCIEKLSILGIRSFGTRSNDKKKIEFYTPLTLILGQNGCGKTTIIESLKYITTGEFPPGCGRSGASFVHDPKISKEPSVKAQIKLLFKNTGGQNVIAARSLEVTQKKTKLECKSFTSSISVTKEDGSTTAVDGKCINFQNEMTSHLGVSKPILENVIFCHQEDSNWPLDEAKKVKDKFDAIFNATKYIKCMDKIRAERKDKSSKIKVLKDTLELLRGWKDQAAKFKNELKTHNEDQEKIKNEQILFENEIRCICDKLYKVKEIEDNALSNKSELTSKEQSLTSIRVMQKEWKSVQTEVFSCSDVELKKLIRDFDQDAQDQLEEEKKFLKQSELTDESLKSLKIQENEAIHKKANLEALHKMHRDNIAKRNDLSQNLVSKYKLFTIDENDFEAVLSELDKKISLEKLKLSNSKKELNIEEKKLLGEMDKIKSEETTLKCDIKMRNDQIRTIDGELRNFELKLSENKNSLSKVNLAELETLLDNINTEIKDHHAKFNIKNAQEEENKLKGNRKKIDNDLDNLKPKIAKLNEQAKERHELDIHTKEKCTQEEKVQFLKRKNADNFEMLFNKVIDDNVRNNLKAKMIDIRQQKNEIRNKEKTLNKTKTELEVKIANCKSSIDEKEKSVKDIDDIIMEICQGSDLDDALKKTQKECDETSKEKGDCESSITMFREFLRRLEKGSNCPLCHRDFDQEEYLTMIREEIEEKLRNLPGKLNKLKKELVQLDKLRVSQLQLEPKKEQADKMRLEINTLKEDLNKFYSKLSDVNCDIDENSTNLDYVTSLEECANAIQPDVVTLDSHMKTIQQLSKKISNIQANLGSLDQTMTMDDLVNHQNELETKRKLLRDEIENLQNKCSDHKSVLSDLENERIRLSTKRLELQSRQQENEKLKEKVQEFNEKKTKLGEEIQNSSVALAPFSGRINDKNNEMSSFTARKDKTIEKQTILIDSIKKHHSSAKECHNLIVEYIRNGKESQFNKSKLDVELLKQKICREEIIKQDITNKISSIQKDISSRREREVNLKNESKIRAKENEAKNISEEVEKLQKEISKFDFNALLENKNRLFKEQEIQSTRLATSVGRLGEVEKQIIKTKESLKQEQIKNAVLHFKKKLIEIKCIELACSDLHKYYIALESAIMQFHRERMATINSIIRELWRSTYKGNDIDYIEIKTDEADSSGSADKKRNYNYRVTMVKNDIDMDMRGRCSAGQKVLASLIIRMALAETFSLKCAILALDEPTTNLDRENIEALSLALLNIVNNRAAQKNFQLIVITHDHEFMEKLTRADFLQYYHEVSRDANGLSTIKRKDVIHSF